MLGLNLAAHIFRVRVRIGCDCLKHFHFDIAAKLNVGAAPGLAAGVSGLVTELPPGFAQRVLLVGRADGIAAAWTAWGATMTAGMAPGVNAYLFANMYGRAKRVAASTVLIATLLCVFTAWGWMTALG